MNPYKDYTQDQMIDEIKEFFSDEMRGIAPRSDLIFRHCQIIWPEMKLMELAAILNRLINDGFIDEVKYVVSFPLMEVGA